MPPEVRRVPEKGQARLDQVRGSDDVVVEGQNVGTIGPPDPNVAPQGDVAVTDRVLLAAKAHDPDVEAVRLDPSVDLVRDDRDDVRTNGVPREALEQPADRRRPNGGDDHVEAHARHGTPT